MAARYRVSRGPSPGRSGAALSTALLTLALPSTALAAIAQKPTPAGRALAQHALVERGNLGRGWSQASAAPRKPPSLTCSGFNPPVHAVEIGRAGSPTWQQSSSGPFVSETTYAYRSAAQELSAWSGVVRPNFVRCAAQALAAGSGRGVRFKVTRKQVLNLLGLAKSARYRISGTATASGQSVDVYLDQIVIGRGQVIGVLSVSSFEAPVASRLELALARAALRRL